GDAVAAGAAEKDAAVGGCKAVIIGLAGWFGAVGVFLVQCLGVRGEKLPLLLIGCQAHSGDQQQFAGLLRVGRRFGFTRLHAATRLGVGSRLGSGKFLLVNLISVAIPTKRSGRGFFFTQELLQHFLPSEFTHDVVLQFFPLRTHGIVCLWKRD